MSDDRVVALEQQVAELRHELQSMRNSLSTAAETQRPTPAAEQPVSRRAALRTAGVVAAGAIAGGIGVVATAAPAAAATGTFVSAPGTPGVSVHVLDVVSAGDGIYVDVQRYGTVGVNVVSTAEASTGVKIQNFRDADCTGMQVNVGAGTGVNTYSDSGVAIRAASTAIGGYFVGAFGGVFEGNNLSGSGVGVMSVGQTVALQLGTTNSSPRGRSTTTFAKGQIDADTEGNLWYCVVGGTPGTWRKISGSTTAGAFHAIAPARVFDSRAAQPGYGVIANNSNRTVSVAHKRDNTGSITTSNIVPEGATAIAANLTVTGTSGTNNFCLNPGSDTSHPASTINWFGSGQSLANGVILAIDSNRLVTIVAGGQGGSAHLIIDVTGYWL